MFVLILCALILWMPLSAFKLSGGTSRCQCAMHARIHSMDDSYSSSFNHGMYAETILHNDDDIIVVNKPANIQTAPGYISKESLATRVSSMFNILRVDHMVVHRLDYATSGVVIFAKHEVASKGLHKLFRTPKRVKKVYKSIVSGSFADDTGTVDLPIGRDPDRGPPYYKTMIDTGTGRNSQTYWEVVESGKSATLVRLIPHTGRTHQLRLHMLAIGHPILGDFFYGQQHSPDLQVSSGSQHRVDRPDYVTTANSNAYERADRLLLHAEELRIFHPRTGVAMAFRADCPFTLRDY